jgi:hypothetical protein
VCLFFSHGEEASFPKKTTTAASSQKLYTAGLFWATTHSFDPAEGNKHASPQPHRLALSLLLLLLLSLSSSGSIWFGSFGFSILQVGGGRGERLDVAQAFLHRHVDWIVVVWIIRV